ncbi:hypothetical protein FGADI_6693 [Fusarium gaditjirri]|uniref:Xylanolytic transcriptional activator regulatory domain-containing protein n=1 Tax=Fusarium gaditjirri TaxID=282569 RepID=A0A8H4WWK0_9HYPO|nr:hypothetical protein FGADI_6693 [Fusarium gaditjirri]
MTPTPSLPRMSLRFLARLTSSHGLVNSFNCDNNVIKGLIPSGLLQDGSRPSFEAVSILTERHVLASKCEEIIRGIRETASQAVDMSLSESQLLSCARFFSPRNVELFLTMFFQIWYPNWPVFHRQTFNPTLKPPRLIAALSLIGATLSPERKHRDQAMAWLETVENWIFRCPDFNEDMVPQTDDDNQDSQVRQRLDILQAAYAVVLLMNWEGDKKARLRARRKRFPDIVYVARSLYPFAMPGTSEAKLLAPCSLYDDWKAFALREELIRTLLYTFLLDCAFVMFYDMSPRMKINELEFGLAATNEHFNASNAEAWFASVQAAENRTVAYSQVTLSQSIRIIMTEDFSATQWEILEQTNPLNLFAITSGKLYGKIKQQVLINSFQPFIILSFTTRMDQTKDLDLYPSHEG